MGTIPSVNQTSTGTTPPRRILQSGGDSFGFIVDENGTSPGSISSTTEGVSSSIGMAQTSGTTTATVTKAFAGMISFLMYVSLFVIGVLNF